jgi:hypothetical protein
MNSLVETAKVEHESHENLEFISMSKVATVSSLLPSPYGDGSIKPSIKRLKQEIQDVSLISSFQQHPQETTSNFFQQSLWQTQLDLSNKIVTYYFFI